MPEKSKPEANGSIETGLRRLEEIADKLEDAGLDLDDAVRLYEEGLRLYEDVAKRLDTTELKITELHRALEEQAKKRTAS